MNDPHGLLKPLIDVHMRIRDAVLAATERQQLDELAHVLATEKAQWHRLHVERDLGDALLEFLAGAEVEGHSLPAPVVDEDP